MEKYIPGTFAPDTPVTIWGDMLEDEGIAVDDLREWIKQGCFVVQHGYDYGDGNGYGYGDGNGNGYGDGDGDGDGDGNGYGYGNGNGYGDGNG